jgi:Bacterial type II and III secretion system protein
MKNIKKHTTFALASFLFLLLFGTMTFAQSKSILVSVLHIETTTKETNLFGGSQEYSTADFNKKYLDAGLLKNISSISVVDGQTGQHFVGNEIPVKADNKTESVVEYINAGKLIKVDPTIIEDENGNPKSVKLTLKFTDNNIDLELSTENNPVVIKREITSDLVIDLDKTIIIGSFFENGIQRYYAVRVQIQ